MTKGLIKVIVRPFFLCLYIAAAGLSLPVMAGEAPPPAKVTVSEASAQTSAADLTTLATLLKAQGDFQCALVQEKTLAGFKRPLRAFGQLNFAADVGLLYQLERPIKARYRMQDGSIDIQEAELPSRRLKSADLPWLEAVSAIFQGALAGDWPRLQQYFYLQLTPARSPAKNWQLQLTPKAASLRAALHSVTVSGEQNLQQIELLDKNADRTLIQLSSCQTMTSSQRAALTDAW